MPKEVSLKDFNEKAEQALKYIVEHATEVTKKAQGNTEIEKEIREFTKKNIDFLMDQAKSVQVSIILYTYKLSYILLRSPINHIFIFMILG